MAFVILIAALLLLAPTQAAFVHSVLPPSLRLAAPDVTPQNTDLTHAIEFSLPTTDRKWIAGGPCGRNDVACMSAVALNETNAIRAAAGSPLLQTATLAQLSNAFSHSVKMADAGRLYHQDLPTTPLGCGAFFAAENVVQNWVSNAGKPTDVAGLCVRHLRDSPPHYENIISNSHRFMAMGIKITNDGAIYCTQTFSTGIKFGPGSCGKAGSGTPPSAPPSRAPKATTTPRGNAASTGHVFKNLTFTGKTKDGTKVKPVLKCAAKCIYCYKIKGRDACLTETRSIEIDLQLTKWAS